MAWIKNRMIAAGEIATKKLTVVPVIPDFTSAVETGNTISITLAMQDPDGVAVARSVDLLCQIYNADGLQAVAGAWRLAETGGGTEVSLTAKPTLICSTNSAGIAVITITDVSGVYSGVMYLKVTPLNTLGSPGLVTVTFA